jgi:hypothetical protein
MGCRGYDFRERHPTSKARRVIAADCPRISAGASGWDIPSQTREGTTSHSTRRAGSSDADEPKGCDWDEAAADAERRKHPSLICAGRA